MIDSLGYIGIQTRDLAAWRTFATAFVGMQAVASDDPAQLALRMDDRRHRFLVRQADRGGIEYFGLTAPDVAALRASRRTLEQAGITVHDATAGELALRGLDAMIWCTDPEGYRLEIGVGLAAATTPFAPGRPIAGFRTGHLGLGHIVMHTARFDAMKAFYCDTLGLKLTDYHHGVFSAAFLRANARHHSFALIGTNGAPEVHHIMLEYTHMDDVGRAYDMALENPERLAVSLGRHYNDHVTSFYVRSPDEFMIELGWAGRLVDDATWVPEEVPSPSLWGHVRYWLPPDRRAAAQAVIRGIGEKGIVRPTDVTDGPGFLRKDTQGA